MLEKTQAMEYTVCFVVSILLLFNRFLTVNNGAMSPFSFDVFSLFGHDDHWIFSRFERREKNAYVLKNKIRFMVLLFSLSFWDILFGKG
jgi:hypothetical protein